MKYFGFILIILIFLSGCSSTEQTNAAKNGTSNLNPNQANVNNSAASVPFNGIQNVNPNAFNASNDNLKVIPTDPKKSQTTVGTRTAPDDSTFTGTMNSKGQPMEIRTFNNHPTLARVEKTFLGKSVQYKVFLKNGKVLDADPEKMSNFAAMSPENILEIVGMLPQVQKKDPDVKEDKNQ